MTKPLQKKKKSMCITFLSCSIVCSKSNLFVFDIYMTLAYNYEEKLKVKNQ
jgi:hypothetical protein